MASILERRVMRVFRESKYINTINIADQVHIDFVWYPGAAQATDSFIDTLIVTPEKGGGERTIEYQWARKGKAPVKRTMLSGRITIPLPPGASGILTVFDTSWQISRAPAATAMAGSATVTGIQQRLNVLGYHLRTPGLTAAGVDGTAGRRTEGAILAFQVDYRPQAGVPAAAAKRLQVRGEWVNNASIAGNLNWYNQSGGGPANFNPSAGDSASLQASLVASAGA